MQSQHCELCVTHRREPSFDEGCLHCIAGESSPQYLFGLPDADDDQRVLAHRAVVAQFARCTTGLHDRLMCSVISASQRVDVATGIWRSAVHACELLLHSVCRTSVDAFLAERIELAARSSADILISASPGSFRGSAAAGIISS